MLALEHVYKSYPTRKGMRTVYTTLTSPYKKAKRSAFWDAMVRVNLHLFVS